MRLIQYLLVVLMAFPATMVITGCGSGVTTDPATGGGTGPDPTDPGDDDDDDDGDDDDDDDPDPGAGETTIGDISIVTSSGTDVLALEPPVVDFGVVLPGETESYTFVVYNNGGAEALFTNDPPVLLQLDSGASGWSIDEQPAEVIGPDGGSVSFTVNYTPEEAELSSATVFLDFEGIGELEFGVKAGIRDEVYIFGNSLPILNGDTSPRPEDLTDFGKHSLKDRGSETHMFNIQNRTGGEITITDLSILLPDDDSTPAGSFELVEFNDDTAWSLPYVLSADASTTFKAKYTALKAGPVTATVRMTYTDATATTYAYNYRILGTGRYAAMEVYAVLETLDEQTGQWFETGTVLLTDETPGETFPSFEEDPDPADPTDGYYSHPRETNKTDFGLHSLGVTKTHRFRILSTGNSVLNIENSPAVVVVGPHYEQFRVVKQPPNSLEAGTADTTEGADGESGEFQIEFRNRFVDSANHDSDGAYVDSTIGPGTPAADADLPDAGDPKGQATRAIVRIDSNAFSTNGAEDKHRPFLFNIAATRYRPALTAQTMKADTDDSYAYYAFPYRNAGWIDFGTDNGALGYTIPHAQTDPKLENQTDFGSSFLGTLTTKRYILRNDDEPERYTDTNGNGVYDEGEPFIDANENGTWDDAQNIALNGSPLINIAGPHADNYRARNIAIGRASSPGSPVSWDKGDATPVLAPGDWLEFDIEFRPTDFSVRNARVEIICTDPVIDRYWFRIGGRGVGPRLEVFDVEDTKIERGDNYPSLLDHTVLLPPLYIADGAARADYPIALGETYTIRNTGNIGMDVGDRKDPSVRAVTLGGEDSGDYEVVLQPYRFLYDSAGGVLGVEEVYHLQPYEGADLHERDDGTFIRRGEAYWELGFNPGYQTPNQETHQQPEEDERYVTIAINTSDPGPIDGSDWDDRPEPDAYTFVVRGTAVDPIMVVRGEGKRIRDNDYSNRGIDETVFHEVDSWGGGLEHSYVVQNAGATWPLPLSAVGKPHFDNQEVIYQIPSGAIGGTTIGIPGMTIDALYAIDQARARHRLPYLWHYTKSWDASVLTRLRDGDHVYVRGRMASASGRIVDLTPDMNEIRGYPDGTIVPDNLLPPPDHALWASVNPSANWYQWIPNWIDRYSDVWPLGPDWNTPTVGAITLEMDEGQDELPSNIVTAPNYYMIDTGGFGGLDGPQPGDDQDVMIVNPNVDAGELIDDDGDGIVDDEEQQDAVFIPGAFVSVTWDWPRMGFTLPIEDFGVFQGDLLVQAISEDPYGPVPKAPRIKAFMTNVPGSVPDGEINDIIFQNNQNAQRALARHLPASLTEWDAQADGFYPAPFDTNGNGRIDVDDYIDGYVDGIPNGVMDPDEGYDTNGDGELTAADVVTDDDGDPIGIWADMLAYISDDDYVGLGPDGGPYDPGDANEDGVVDFDDLDLDGFDSVFTTVSTVPEEGLLTVQQDLRTHKDGEVGRGSLDGYGVDTDGDDISDGVDWNGDGWIDTARSLLDFAPPRPDPLDGDRPPTSPDRFRLVLPGKFSIRYTHTIRIVKEDFEFANELPSELDAGLESLLHVVFRPRWSTGVDRNRTGGDLMYDDYTDDLITEMHPDYRYTEDYKGWDSVDLSAQVYNMDPDPRETYMDELLPGTNFAAPYEPGTTGLYWDGFPSTNWVNHPGGGAAVVNDEDPSTNDGLRGGLEHMVEVNIPNADIDTWFDWKTGYIPSQDAPDLIPWINQHPSFPERVPGVVDGVPQDYCDEMSPDFEFAVLGTSRNPNIALNIVDGTYVTGSQWFYSTHPGYGLYPSPRPVGSPGADMGSVERTSDPDDVARRNFRIHNHEYDYNLGGELRTSYTPYLPAGSLRLDEGKTWRLTGSGAGDYSIELVPPVDPSPEYSLPIEPVTWPITNWVSTQYVQHEVTFDPKANGTRSATQDIPSNDASFDPLKTELIGVGVEPASKPSPLLSPDGDG
ncbi:MAG: choice-of-anchor D domain-containing protein [Planctomycetota bacterium]